MVNDRILVNIACGDAFVDGWFNFDYSPVSSKVIKVNLLGTVPCSDASADVVYSSHFLEHIPRHKINHFLSECFRILKSKGVIRLVLPDFEEMARNYLKYRESGSHQEADFLMLEIFDQLVRTFPGGELGEYYSRLEDSDPKMIHFVRKRTGFRLDLNNKKVGSWREWIIRIINNPTIFYHFFEKIYINSVLKNSFRRQSQKLTSPSSWP